MHGVDFFRIGTSRIHTLGLVANAPRMFDQRTSFWVSFVIKSKLSSLFHLVQLKVLRSTQVIPSKANKDDKVPTHRPFSRLCLCLRRGMLPRLLRGRILLRGQFGLKCDQHHYSRRLYFMHGVVHLPHRICPDGWRYHDHLLQFRVQIQRLVQQCGLCAGRYLLRPRVDEGPSRVLGKFARGSGCAPLVVVVVECRRPSSSSVVVERRRVRRRLILRIRRPCLTRLASPPSPS